MEKIILADSEFDIYAERSDDPETAQLLICEKNTQDPALSLAGVVAQRTTRCLDIQARFESHPEDTNNKNYWGYSNCHGTAYYIMTGEQHDKTKAEFAIDNDIFKEIYPYWFPPQKDLINLSCATSKQMPLWLYQPNVGKDPHSLILLGSNDRAFILFEKLGYGYQENGFAMRTYPQRKFQIVSLEKEDQHSFFPECRRFINKRQFLCATSEDFNAQTV